MQTKGRFFDDFARMANGAAGTFSGLRREIEGVVRQRLERLLADMDLVTRDEFESVKEVAAQARLEQERLAARVAELESALGVTPGGGAGAGKSATKTAGAKKAAAKKTGTKKAAAKKTGARKAAAKKSSGKKTAGKTAAAKAGAGKTATAKTGTARTPDSAPGTPPRPDNDPDSGGSGGGTGA